MRVGMLDGIVAVPMGVAAVHLIGVRVVVVSVVVAVFMFVLNDAVAVGVLVGRAQRERDAYSGERDSHCLGDGDGLAEQRP